MTKMRLTYQLGLREAQSKLEGKQLSKKKAHDTLIVADRKYNSNHNALKEASTLLEQTDRARRIVKQELADTNETLSEKKAQCAMIDAARLAKISQVKKTKTKIACESSDMANRLG